MITQKTVQVHRKNVRKSDNEKKKKKKKEKKEGSKKQIKPMTKEEKPVIKKWNEIDSKKEEGK